MSKPQKKNPHARSVERVKYRNAAVMQGGILGADELVLKTMCEFAHGASHSKIAEALGIQRLTAVRWRREMTVPKRLNAGGGYSAGKKVSNG
jgi:hypothetical protein